ncbi:hypothetical protein HK405_006443, partial [Cladochytrium tenue]
RHVADADGEAAWRLALFDTYYRGRTFAAALPDGGEGGIWQATGGDRLWGRTEETDDLQWPETGSSRGGTLPAVGGGFAAPLPPNMRRRGHEGPTFRFHTESQLCPSYCRRTSRTRVDVYGGWTTAVFMRWYGQQRLEKLVNHWKPIPGLRIFETRSEDAEKGSIMENYSLYPVPNINLAPGVMIFRHKGYSEYNGYKEISLTWAGHHGPELGATLNFRPGELSLSSYAWPSRLWNLYFRTMFLL